MRNNANGSIHTDRYSLVTRPAAISVLLPLKQLISKEINLNNGKY